MKHELQNPPVGLETGASTVETTVTESDSLRKELAQQRERKRSFAPPKLWLMK
jgi:hypothetical protein